VAARHDGGGHPDRGHARRVRQTGPAAWQLWDAPASPASAVARFHLAPGAHALVTGQGAAVALDGRRLRLQFEGAAAVTLTETPHAVGFGRVVPAPTLDVRLSDRVLVSRLEADG
jgi:hypothetical protein